MPKYEPKRLEQPQDRIPSQQETFRNMPAVHPSASPVNTEVAQTPVRPLDQRQFPQQEVPRPQLPDQAPILAGGTPPVKPGIQVGGDTSAQLMAQTMGMLMTDTSNYLQYQVGTLGELNQKEQRARALLGLPQTHGRGLGLGSDIGYSSGLGEAAGIKLKSEYESATEAMNYGFDGNLDPEAAAKKRQDVYNELFQKYANGRQQDPAFIEGIQRHAVEAKLVQDTEADKFYSKALAQTKLDSAGTLVGDVASKFKQSLQGFRESNPNASEDQEQTFLTNARLNMRGAAKHIAEISNVPLDTANGILIDKIKDQAIGMLSGPNADLHTAEKLMEALGTKDPDGYTFATPMSKSYKVFSTASHEFQSAKTQVIEEQTKIAKHEAEQKLGTSFKAALTGELTSDNFVKWVQDGKVDQKDIPTLETFLEKQKDGDYLLHEDDKLVTSLVSRVAEGSIDFRGLAELRNNKQITRRTFETLNNHLQMTFEHQFNQGMKGAMFNMAKETHEASMQRQQEAKESKVKLSQEKEIRSLSQQSDAYEFPLSFNPGDKTSVSQRVRAETLADWDTNKNTPGWTPTDSFNATIKRFNGKLRHQLAPSAPLDLHSDSQSKIDALNNALNLQ